MDLAFSQIIHLVCYNVVFFSREELIGALEEDGSLSFEHATTRAVDIDRLLRSDRGPFLKIDTPGSGWKGLDCGPDASLEIIDLLCYLQDAVIYKFGVWQPPINPIKLRIKPRVLQQQSWHVTQQSGWVMYRYVMRSGLMEMD